MLAICALLVLVGEAAVGSETEGGEPGIDQRSFRLGDFYALADMVHLGIKKDCGFYYAKATFTF